MVMTRVKRIGLLAGAGGIPLYFARKAKEHGVEVVSISFSEEIGSQLEPYVDRNYSIGIGKAGKILKTMKEEDLWDIVIMGKVEKEMIFKLQMFDLDSLKLMKSVIGKSNTDRAIMESIIAEAVNRGITILDQKEFMPELFPEQGVLTKAKPNASQKEDIAMAMPIARAMADQEIGQTVIVKNHTVIAVEAVEGTDRAIKRGCELSHGGCTVAKASRTNQDYRFDSPGIGPRTIEGLIQGRAAVLAIEAGRVMIIDREESVALADKAGLSIVCV